MINSENGSSRFPAHHGRLLSIDCCPTRRAMEALVAEGAAKAIGVSNFGERQLGALLEAARIKPVVNQVELHPLLSQRRLVGACARKVRGAGCNPRADLRPLSLCASCTAIIWSCSRR